MRVYLDHQAGTPLLPEVKLAMEPFLKEEFGNPSSRHREGFRAREALDRAREQVATALDASSPEEIIFTGNGTEAVNLGIKGAAWSSRDRGQHIIISAAEHPAVAESVSWLRGRGFNASILPVDSDGTLSIEAVGDALRDDTILICTHHVNHDIGTVQHVAELANLAHNRSIPLFIDAIASAGWMSCNVEELQADLIAVSPHRFYGPKGVGILYKHRRSRLNALVHGGEQEMGFRAGTENVPAIVGAGVAMEIAKRDVALREATTRQLQTRALKGIRASVPYIKLNGPEPGPRRHPANLNLSVEFAEGEALGLMLDVKGVAAATGSACVAREKRVPPILAAIGLPEGLARGNVILSFGAENTEREVDFCIETFAKAVINLREMSPEWSDFQNGLTKSILAG